MTITLNADYDVTLNTALLGYVGETNARPVSVEGHGDRRRRPLCADDRLR